MAAPKSDWLSTALCAARIGVTTGYVVGEIRDGRLAAMVLSRPGKRACYRVSEPAFESYLARHWRPAGPARPRAFLRGTR